TLLEIFFQAEVGIRYFHVNGVQTCALPILSVRRALTVYCTGFPGPTKGRAAHSSPPAMSIILEHLAAIVGDRYLLDADGDDAAQIGRASCRVRVAVYISER